MNKQKYVLRANEEEKLSSNILVCCCIGGTP
jgi:hypothetical protein